MTRLIRKSKWSCRQELAQLIEGLMIGELITPGPCLWIVSPHVRDIAILDNRGGHFHDLDTTWGLKIIRLSDVVLRLLSLGGRVVIATRKDIDNDRFLEDIKRTASLRDLSGGLTLHSVQHLHEAGILGSQFHLSGSLELTFEGLNILEDTIQYTTAAAQVAAARLDLQNRWGGVL